MRYIANPGFATLFTEMQILIKKHFFKRKLSVQTDSVATFCNHPFKMLKIMFENSFGEHVM